MISSQKPRLVKAGLLGLSQDFDTLHRPAIHNLSQRLQICWVHDAIPLRAQQFASDMRIPYLECMQQLFQQQQLEAVILLQNHWYSSVPIELCLHRQKSILCLANISQDLPITKLKDWHERASQAGLSIILGLTRRYAPATIRLQELVASKIGRIKEIEIHLPLKTLCRHHANQLLPQQEVCPYFIQATDWCRHLFKRKMQLVSSQGITQHFDQECSAEILVPAWESVPEVHITIKQIPISATEETPSWKINVTAEQGTAEIIGYRRISWQTSTESGKEELLSERSSLELLLDLFCRRMLSGLVPLPDLGDLIRARELYL